MIKNRDPSLFMKEFIAKLDSIYCNSFPLKTKYVSAKNYLNPWVTPKIRKLIQIRANFFKWSKLNIIERSEYNRLRNKVNRIIDKSKTVYFSRLFVENCNNLSKTWQLIRYTHSVFLEKGNSCLKLLLAIAENVLWSR